MTRLPIIIKEKATILRKQGFSLREISENLHISKSTASVWVAKIRLDLKAEQRLKNLGILGQYKTILVREKKREKLLKEFETNAKNDLLKLNRTKEQYKIMCSIMFWCEGSKNSSSGVKFTNSDPMMIKAFLYLLKKSFIIDNKKLRALVHLHQYHDENKQIKFWSDITGIPRAQFNKSYHKPNTGKRTKEDYQGCIAISYFDVKVARELTAYYKNFQFLGA